MLEVPVNNLPTVHSYTVQKVSLPFLYKNYGSSTRGHGDITTRRLPSQRKTKIWKGGFTSHGTIKTDIIDRDARKSGTLGKQARLAKRLKKGFHAF